MNNAWWALALSAVIATSAAAQQQQPAQPAAPSSMSRSELQAEVTAQRPFIQFGGVQPRRPAGCTAAENRQFDFWLGEWDVSPTGQTFVLAESTISAHAQGCVMMENWRPLRGAHGYSINMYDSADGLWHQEYGDATGRRTVYSGRFTDGVMALDNLSAPPPNSPPDFRARMNFQRIDENTVRQWGETFTNGEWTTAWDLTYRRRAGTR